MRLGLYTGNKADQIALLYIYFPIIRQEVYAFVDLWNTHTIRRQNNRPHVPTGKPVVLYLSPPEGVVDYGTKPDLTLLGQLKHDVEQWGT